MRARTKRPTEIERIDAQADALAIIRRGEPSWESAARFLELAYPDRWGPTDKDSQTSVDLSVTTAIEPEASNGN